MAIEALKVSCRLHVARVLAQELLKPLYDSILDEWKSSDDEEFLIPIVPVPGSVQGRRYRGFDQSALLVRQMVSGLPPGARPPILNLIIRTTGQTQKSLNRRDRAENAHVQYRAAHRNALPDAVPPRVVIVDDVVTTGASLQRCGTILTELGVQEWRGIALAARL